MRLDTRLARLEDAERDEQARAMAEEADMSVEEVRRQLHLWDRLLVLHDLAPDEVAEEERIRTFLVDFAARSGDEDPERYADETIAEWRSGQQHQADDPSANEAGR